MLEYTVNTLIPNFIFWGVAAAVVGGVLVFFAKTWKFWLYLVFCMVIGSVCGAAILGDGLLPLDSMTLADSLGAGLGALLGLMLSGLTYESDDFD